MDEASIIAPSEAQGDPNDPYAARLEQRQAAGEDVTSISLGERFKRAARAVSLAAAFHLKTGLLAFLG
jgi:hypothetical protein